MEVKQECKELSKVPQCTVTMAQFHTGALKTKDSMVFIRDKRDGIFILPPSKLISPWLNAWTPEGYKSPHSGSKGLYCTENDLDKQMQKLTAGNENTQGTEMPQKNKGVQKDMSGECKGQQGQPPPPASPKGKQWKHVRFFFPKVSYYYIFTKGIWAHVDVWQIIQGEQSRYGLRLMDLTLKWRRQIMIINYDNSMKHHNKSSVRMTGGVHFE